MTDEVKKRIADIDNSIVPEGYKKTKAGIVPADWEGCHFKEMFERLKRKNTENNTNVLTISAKYGLINQEEFFNKSVASDDKSNYFLLYKGDFAYNKSYSNGYPFGAIKSLERYEKGIVSPLYICFSPTEENICPEYYLQYFENGNMNNEINAIAQEGARNHGLLNIGINDFFNSYIPVPPLAEQHKIAEILSTQDRLTELQERKTEQLKMLKKGYLQKMFPKKDSKYPELRFNGFSEPWQKKKFKNTVEIERGGSPRPIESFITNDNNGLNWVKIGDAPLQGNYITKTAEKIKPEGLSKTREVHPNDLILSNSMSFGKPYIMAINGCIHDGWLLIRNTQNIFDLGFLCVMLGTQQMLKQYKSLASGSTVNNLNKELVGNTNISYPLYNEQQKIGEFFSNLDRLIELNERKLEEEKQKKKALMQLLLTGKMRVKP